jgi:hypothetical protein
MTARNKSFRVFFLDDNAGPSHFDTQDLKTKNAVRYWCQVRDIKYYNIVDHANLSEYERSL